MFNQRPEMHTSNRGRGRGSYSQVFRNNNGPLENKNLDRALGEALYNSNNSNSNNNNYNTGRGRGRGQNNRTYRSNNNKGPNRQTFNKKQQQTSIPPVNESFVKKKQTQAQADRAARFGSSSKSEIYAQLKKDRIIEREQAIKNGLIPDPNTPRRLEDAIDFRGICQTKCPQFEMVERDIQNSVDRLEMDEEGNLDKNKAVKAYRRSAAGNDQPLPADVRSPEALIATLDYLIDKVLSVYTLEKCHAFIRDRTRSIRQDFTLQNIRDITAVQVHERIARFHILCLHEMCGMDESKFSEQQETEQLRKVLLSLMEFYEDLREEGIETPNEAEFRAYYILTHIRDKDVVKQTMTQPVHVFKHPHIQLALKFYAMAQRNNEIEETSSRRNKAENALASKNSYASFFKWIASPKTPFLMACLLETHFPEVRKGAMKAMNVGYMMRAAGVEASFVQNVLCYDSLAQCLQEAKHYGIGMDMSLEEPTLLFGQRHHETRVHVFLEPLSYLTQKKSSLVDLKKGGQSFRSIVNGVDMPVAAPAHTPNVPVSAFQPTASRTLDMAEKSKKAKEAAAEQKKKIELVAEARRQAEKAEAKAAEERRKLEAFIEQKRQEQLLQEKTRLVQEAAERQKQMELKRKEELEMREQLRRKQEEAERQRMIEEQQRKEAEERRIKKMEEERLKKLKQDTARKMMEELLKQVIKEETARIVRNQTRVRKILEKKASIWASRARARISKRNSKIDLLKSKHVFSWSVVRHHPYFRPSFLKNGAPKLEDEEEIKKKARQSLIAEQMALEKNTIVDNQMVWKTENFSNNIYPQIWSQVDEFRRNHPSLLKKLNWQLLISAENKQLQSSTWYRSKFGLDNEFLRRIGIYDKYDVTCRMVCKETNPITRHIAEEVGGVVFSLAELDTRTKSKEEMQIYWNKSAARLTSLIQDIGKHNPTATFPILITYFPDGTDTSETLKKIPGLLGLSNHEQINDFRLVIMNPQTISTRIVDEVNWLASRSSINFPV